MAQAGPGLRGPCEMRSAVRNIDTAAPHAQPALCTRHTTAHTLICMHTHTHTHRPRPRPGPVNSGGLLQDWNPLPPAVGPGAEEIAST